MAPLFTVEQATALIAARQAELAGDLAAAGEISGLSKSSVEIAEKAGELLLQIVPGIRKTAVTRQGGKRSHAWTIYCLKKNYAC